MYIIISLSLHLIVFLILFYSPSRVEEISSSFRRRSSSSDRNLNSKLNFNQSYLKSNLRISKSTNSKNSTSPNDLEQRNQQVIKQTVEVEIIKKKYGSHPTQRQQNHSLPTPIAAIPNSENQAPIYPQEAIIQKLEGDLVLKVTTNRFGIVDQIGIEKSSGHKILDLETVQTVKKWHLQPDATFLFPFRFKLSTIN